MTGILHKQMEKAVWKKLCLLNTQSFIYISKIILYIFIFLLEKNLIYINWSEYRVINMSFKLSNISFNIVIERKNKKVHKIQIT